MSLQMWLFDLNLPRMSLQMWLKLTTFAYANLKNEFILNDTDHDACIKSKHHFRFFSK